MGMIKLDFWRADWFLGIVVVPVVPDLLGRDLIQSMDRKACNPGEAAQHTSTARPIG
jgi:hypothetical protein